MSIQPSSIPSAPIQAPAGGLGAGGSPAPAVPANSGNPAPDVKKTVAVSPAAPAATDEQLKQAIEALQRHFTKVAPELQFSVDRASGKAIIKVTDPSTNEVIQQIPSEEAMRITKEIDRFQQGLLLNKKG